MSEDDFTSEEVDQVVEAIEQLMHNVTSEKIKSILAYCASEVAVLTYEEEEEE